MAQDGRESRRPDEPMFYSEKRNRKPFVPPAMAVTPFAREDVISQTRLPGADAIAAPIEPF